MSFLANMFGHNTVREDWNQLSSMDELDKAEKESNERAVVLFKHSVSCGVSAYAKHKMENGFDINPENCGFYYLDLLAHRDISNEIAHRYGVMHQSPQMIILRNGQAVFNASHHAVSLTTLKENISA